MDPQKVNTCRYHQSCWRRLRRLQRKVWKQRQTTKRKKGTGTRCGSSCIILTVASRSAFRALRKNLELSLNLTQAMFIEKTEIFHQSHCGHRSKAFPLP